MPISTSLSCSCGFLSCSFIWKIFHCHFIFSNFLCLSSPFCWQVIVSPASRVCPLVGEFGSEACAGFLLRGAGACPQVGGSGSSPSGGQDCVKEACLQVAVSSVWLQASCLLMGGSVFLSCWLFGPGVCRLLGRAESWCQSGNLLGSSRWPLFSGVSVPSVLAPQITHSQPPSLQETLQDS